MPEDGSAGPRRSWLDTTERIAKIFAIVAIPVVIPVSLAIYSAKVESPAVSMSSSAACAICVSFVSRSSAALSCAWRASGSFIRACDRGACWLGPDNRREFCPCAGCGPARG